MEDPLSNKPTNVMSESFLRQRRNVFIINAILLFMMCAKVQASKLTVVGISFEKFGNPNAVYLFLWVIWFYFIYRFMLYLLEDELLTIKNKWNQYYHLFLDKKLRSLLLKVTDNVNLAEYSYSQISYNNFKCEIRSGTNEYNEPKFIVESFHPSQFWFSKIRFSFYLLFSTTITTNYCLPIVFSLFTFIYTISSDWEGSLINIILHP